MLHQFSVIQSSRSLSRCACGELGANDVQFLLHLLELFEVDHPSIKFLLPVLIQDILTGFRFGVLGAEPVILLTLFDPQADEVALILADPDEPFKPLLTCVASWSRSSFRSATTRAKSWSWVAASASDWRWRFISLLPYSMEQHRT